MESRRPACDPRRTSPIVLPSDAVEPGILNSLLYEASEFIETQSFSILPRREAMRALELQRDQLIASDDVVESQVAEMDVALNELGDGQFCMGEYEGSPDKAADDLLDFFSSGRPSSGGVGGSIEPAADDDGVLMAEASEPERAASP